jgi:acyl-CoA dehydrogenase
MAVCYEEMNRSIFGPVVFNSAAPDDGNMMVLEKAATEAQKARWLAPIVAGAVRSSFAMTEPHPGGGSDPGMMLTRATRRGDRWVIEGRKWYITGAGEAAHFILIARTGDDARRGLTAFLFHRDQPGWHIARRIPIMGPEEHGGHCELVFDGLEIPDDQVLMGVGDGLKLTQIRLGPARLTHCMRWLGAAARCQHIALEHARVRTAFGKPLLAHQGVNFMLADNEIALHQARLAIRHVAWLLDNGVRARHESSIVKASVSEDLFKVADRCVQILGGIGVTSETVVEMIFRDMRPFRLYDGPTEVHKFAIATQLERQGSAFTDPVGW